MPSTTLLAAGTMMRPLDRLDETTSTRVRYRDAPQPEEHTYEYYLSRGTASPEPWTYWPCAASEFESILSQIRPGRYVFAIIRQREGHRTVQASGDAARDIILAEVLWPAGKPGDFRRLYRPDASEKPHEIWFEPGWDLRAPECEITTVQEAAAAFRLWFEHYRLPAGYSLREAHRIRQEYRAGMRE